MVSIRALLSFLLLLGIAFPVLAKDVTTPHPAVAKLITEGFSVAPDERSKLLPPLVNETMSAKEQKASLTKLVGKTRLSQFMRKSPLARLELDIKTLGETDGGAAIRGFDLYFVAYGNLDAVSETNFAGEEEHQKEDQPFETYFEPLDGRPDSDTIDLVEWAKKPRLYRYRFALLDKVVVSGLLEGQAHIGKGVAIQSMMSPENKLNDADHPSQWRPIPQGVDNDAGLGSPQPFRGLAGYLHATELKFQKGAVLVEVHSVYVEPEGWFDGKNLLASKLPLTMKDNVANFRRKIAKKQREK